MRVPLPNTGFPGWTRNDDFCKERQLRSRLSGGVELEIPRLGCEPRSWACAQRIVGTRTGWQSKLGWLEGTAFPSWQGNAVPVAHNHLRSGLPGPFADLDELRVGDRLLVHVYGQAVAYEVQSVTTIDSQDGSVWSTRTTRP